jgi:hypothetical protein
MHDNLPDSEGDLSKFLFVVQTFRDNENIYQKRKVTEFNGK